MYEDDSLENEKTSAWDNAVRDSFIIESLSVQQFIDLLRTEPTTNECKYVKSLLGKNFTKFQMMYTKPVSGMLNDVFTKEMWTPKAKNDPKYNFEELANKFKEVKQYL